MRSLFCVATGVALLIGQLSLGCTAARANESPEDTSNLKSLTPEQARKLVELETNSSLPLHGLTALDVDTAKALAEFKGHTLILCGLTTLDADAAKALAEFKGDILYLNGLTTLDAETAKGLAGYKGQILPLDGLTSLDAETAKALAEFKGAYLLLRGLTKLDADTAKALAEFKGALQLNGLTSLDADTAKVIAEFKGKVLFLNGLTTLDADTAKALAAAKRWDGDLRALTALDSPDSIAIAQALATRKGLLKLPNLKEISPKTLSALIEKQDLEIPLIETLELIPEQDGSVTEDFVIPEGFQKARQRQSK